MLGDFSELSHKIWIALLCSLRLEALFHYFLTELNPGTSLLLRFIGSVHLS
jgi:hypothetical protein